MTNEVQFNRSLRAWMDVFMHRSMRGWNQFARSTGLSMPQFSILMQLHHKGPCGVSELSTRFDITAAAASQLAEKLVQAGYVERTEDPGDRRAKMLSLTDSGSALIRQGIEERFRWLEGLSSALSPEERQKVSEALGLLTEAARRLDA